jgi:signal transduction histidine kinase
MKDTRKTKAQLIEELEGLRLQLEQREPAVVRTAAPDRALLCALADQMLEPTVILDWEGNMLHGNALAAEVLCVDGPDEIVGMNIAGILHPDAIAQAANDLQQVQASEAAFAASYKLLENMEHGSKRIASIVSELKDHVRTEENHKTSPESIDTIVKSMMTIIGKQVRKMVKHLEMEVAENLPLIMMNAGRIEQVLINLLINAGQAADKEDSFVRLIARRNRDDANQVEILIEDNGSGIAEDDLDKVFEMLYTTKGSESGTGLGLSISHRIIEEHGGSLNVKSTVGESTCFTICLPAVKD